MQVCEWMTPAPVTVTPSVPIPKVQELMLHRRIRHLPEHVERTTTIPVMLVQYGT
jgi:CBS domain-containing protein